MLPSDQWLSGEGSLRVDPQPGVDICTNCILDVSNGIWEVIMPLRPTTFNQLVLVSGANAWPLNHNIGTQPATVQVTGTGSVVGAYLSCDYSTISAPHNSAVSQLLVVHQ